MRRLGWQARFGGTSNGIEQARAMHDTVVERWLAGLETNNAASARITIDAPGLLKFKKARLMAERVSRLAASHPDLDVRVDRHLKPRWVEVTRRSRVTSPS